MPDQVMETIETEDNSVAHSAQDQPYTHVQLGHSGAILPEGLEYNILRLRIQILLYWPMSGGLSIVINRVKSYYVLSLCNCSIDSTAPPLLDTTRLVGKNRGLLSREPGTEESPDGSFRRSSPGRSSASRRSGAPRVKDYILLLMMKRKGLWEKDLLLIISPRRHG